MKAKHPDKEATGGKQFVQDSALQPRQEKLQKVYANRVLEEWRANVQLYIHHDNLKQERMRHFLSMQGALLAFVGLSTKQALEASQSRLIPITFLLFSIGISVIGFFLDFNWKAMDDRARKFTLFERKSLRELESQWRLLLPDDERGLSTYTALAVILEKGGEKFQCITDEECKKIKQAYHGDYKVLEDQGGPASGRETFIFKALLFFWSCSTVGHIALLITFLLRRHF